MTWIFCWPITNFAVWKGSLLNIQLTCSYMQAPGNAVEGLGRSEGTPGSRCPPSEQPTPLPNPKDACPFQNLVVLEDLSPSMTSWKTSLDDLLQLQDDRACPAAVLLPLESRDRSRTSAELASKRPSLPPRFSHGRSNLTLLHSEKSSLENMRNTL